jgi:hypothetical protein
MLLIWPICIPAHLLKPKIWENYIPTANLRYSAGSTTAMSGVAICWWGKSYLLFLTPFNALPAKSYYFCFSKKQDGYVGIVP